MTRTRWFRWWTAVGLFLFGAIFLVSGQGFGTVLGAILLLGAVVATMRNLRDQRAGRM